MGKLLNEVPTCHDTASHAPGAGESLVSVVNAKRQHCQSNLLPPHLGGDAAKQALAAKSRAIDLVNRIEVGAIYRMHMRLIQGILGVHDVALAVLVSVPHLLRPWQ